MRERPSNDPHALQKLQAVLSRELDIGVLTSLEWLKLIPVILWILEHAWKALEAYQDSQDSKNPAG